jgi:alkylhydroperoxidase family enzyme
MNGASAVFLLDLRLSCGGGEQAGCLRERKNRIMTQPHPTPQVPHYRSWKVAVPLPGDADLSPETKELLSQGAPIHVLRMFAPGIAALIKGIFTAQGVDPKLREIIILRTAYLTNCAYEWEANVVFARNVGLTDEHMALLCTEGPVSGLDPLSNLISRATDEITQQAAISDDALAQLLEQFGPAVTTKYILAISWFNMLSRFLLSTRVPRETNRAVLEGRTAPF